MKATIDRIEDGWAVLILEEGEGIEVELPRCMLPCGSGEGDVVDICITKDEEATREATERVSGLLDRLQKKSPKSTLIRPPPGKDERDGK